MLPWSFSEEAAAEKHMPQLQHNMWVVAARAAVLSIITGGGKWVEIKIHADPLHQHLIVTAERKFWRCVESGEPPTLFGVEPPKPRHRGSTHCRYEFLECLGGVRRDVFSDAFGPSRARTGQGRVEEPDARRCAASDRLRHPSQALEIRRHQFRPPGRGWQSCSDLVNRSPPSPQPSPRLKSSSSIRKNRWSRLFVRMVPRRAERTFHYASLSSGLDIVRKVLGQHEIATMQTTSTDRSASIISLTTMLAHASGEWIASDWPVCAVDETANPQRMGAALTYARRYALFTLVGIAGEDDLDAPDLTTPTNRGSGPEKPKGNGNGRLNGGQHSPDPAQRRSVHRDAKAHSQSNKAMLGADASAELRDRLVAELSVLSSSDEAVLWAHRCHAEKNRLTAADAERVEEAFRARMATLTPDIADLPQSAGEPAGLSPHHPDGTKPKNRARAKVIDKSVLALPEPRRIRDRDHVKFVARHPCLICGRQPSDAHHLRFVQSRALGGKVSDEFTVPLCRGHHREVHRCGDEVAWWSNTRVDPIVAARALWLDTHPQSASPDKTRTKPQLRK